MPDRKTGTKAPPSVDPEIRFPGESSEYRRARNRLLAAEAELRRMLETVAAQRRALPRGGLVAEDYRFEEAEGGGEVSFSELFAPGKDTLVIYSFMFPRSPGDTRPGPVSGETAGLALTEMPCPSCASILDGLDGAAPHLAQRLDLAVVAKSAPERIRAFARERGWRHLRLLSSRSNAYNGDYHAETSEGQQLPILNVFVRDGEEIRHTWASELLFAPRNEGEDARHVDLIWPIWSVLDMTPHGRGSGRTSPDSTTRSVCTDKPACRLLRWRGEGPTRPGAGSSSHLRTRLSSTLGPDLLSAAGAPQRPPRALSAQRRRRRSRLPRARQDAGA